LTKSAKIGRSTQDLRLLAELTRETLSSMHLGHLLWQVVLLLRRRFGYDFAAVALIDGCFLVYRAASGGNPGIEFHEPADEAPWRLTFGEGIAGVAAASGRSQLSSDVEKDSRYLPAAGLADCRSMLAVPFSYNGAVLGILDVRRPVRDGLDETDRLFLEAVAAVVAPAVQAARRYEKERRRARHRHLVNEISRLVMSSLDPQELIATACQAMLEVLDISFVAIVLVDPDVRRVMQQGHATRCPFVRGLDFEHWSIEIGEGLVGNVIRTGEPARVDDVSNDPTYREVVQGVRSHLSVPLKVQGQTVGALVVEHTEAHRFGIDDERLLENISGYLVQAIENARLFQVQRERWRQLLLINEVARLINKIIDIESMCLLTVREVQQRFSFPTAAVFLCKDKHAVLEAQACVSHPLVAPGYREANGKGIVGLSVKLGRTVVAHGPDEFKGSLPLIEGARSALCVPLTAGPQTLGALVVQSPLIKAFDAEDQLVLETLAKSVGSALANAQALSANERLREDLNRMVVHDLRNPVHAVQLTLEDIGKNEMLTERGSDGIRQAIETTADILQMVGGLLDLSRFEAGRVNLRLRPTVLNDHVRAVVRRLGPVARNRGVQVTTVLSPELPVLYLDHELIDRTISNLVGNGLKFTSEGGNVSIATKVGEDIPEPLSAWRGRHDPFVILSVRDTGEGIPKAYHQKIFEKFGQVESRQAGLQMSTGLGLTLCRHVVEGHNGHIWVESVPGQGATFYVALSVRRPRSKSI
jgi:NtrC-family two-component system sensor histidine kinase KinB